VGVRTCLCNYDDNVGLVLGTSKCFILTLSFLITLVVTSLTFLF